MSRHAVINPAIGERLVQGNSSLTGARRTNVRLVFSRNELVFYKT